MNTTLMIPILLASLASARSVHAAQQCDGNHTLRLDAVELVAGKEVQGRSDIAVTHDRFEYHFARAENRKEFLAHPDRYEIQMGGACGSMGPLSGDGTTNIWAVHDGRIYIFASEGCRTRFLTSPDAMIDRDESVPVAGASESARNRGRELIDLAVRGMGGAERVDAAVTYIERLSVPVESGDRTYQVKRTVIFRLPDGICSEECWDDGCWSDTIVGQEGWRQSSTGATPMHAQQWAAHVRARSRHPLYLLRARNQDGFLAIGEGRRQIISVPDEGDVEVELLTIAWGGANTVLGIEPASGRVRLVRFRGRGLNSSLGDTQRTYASFREIGGLTLASRVHVSFDGKPRPNYSGTFDLQAINRPEDLLTFENPATPKP